MAVKLNNSRVSQLNKDEPFTPSESHKFNRNIQYFIRGIQLVNNCTKKEAISFYKKYKTGMPKAKRQIYAKDVHDALADDSAGRRNKRGKDGKKHIVKAVRNQTELDDEGNYPEDTEDVL